MSKKSLLEGKRVLLVDDEQDVLESLEDLLSSCETAKASSYEEAISLMNERVFDVAVLDIMGVSGYELLKAATEKEIIAVMLTARAVSSDHIVKSYEEGASYYIPKEEMSNIEELLNDILEAIEQNKSPWDRWFSRMMKFCERNFGENWRIDEKEKFKRLPFFY